MSSELSGTLRVSRRSPALIAIAARTLDPRSLAAWLRSGRSEAEEAQRLHLQAAEERARAQSRAGGPGETPGPGEFPFAPLELARTELELAALAGGFFAEPTLDPGGEPLGLPTGSGGAEILSLEQRMLAAAFATALAADGFRPGAAPLVEEGTLTVQGRRGDQQAAVSVRSDGRLLLDVGPEGFRHGDDCRATAESLRWRLAEYGIDLLDLSSGDGSGQLQPISPELVTGAVAASLPGFDLHASLEGDELQIVALPSVAEDGGDAARPPEGGGRP